MPLDQLTAALNELFDLAQVDALLDESDLPPLEDELSTGSEAS